MPTDFLNQLNQLSDVELPVLGLLAVLGFVIVLIVIGMMFRSIARGQEKRETALTGVFTSALNTLSEQVNLNREAYLDAKEEFRGLREASTTGDASIVAAVTMHSDAVKRNSAAQADRAIGMVEERIATAETNFQSSINVLNQQLQNVNALLAALDMKVTSATATQSETKSTIEIVRSMVNDALELIRARQDAEDGLLNNGEGRLKELEVQSLPTPPIAAFKPPPTPP